MTSLQSLNQKSQGVNWVACVFWGILIGGAILTFNHYREPILAFIAKPTINFSWINNLTLNKIVAFLKDYGVLFSAAGIGITFIYGFYQKHQANKAALQLVTAQQNANTEINTAYSTAETYRKQAETYKTQVKTLQATDSPNLLNEAQTIITQKTEAVKKLQAQVQALQDMLMLKDTKVIVKEVVK